MLRRVFGATLPRALRERRDVSGMREQMLAHGEREGRAWPKLARLMKNGQESAYLACPSLHSNAAPPPFLLSLSPTLLPPLPPPSLFTLHALPTPSISPQFPHFDLCCLHASLAQIQTSLYCLEPDTIPTR
ncbi:hypothetical protein CgunFtcFv8_018508 [Champsocephalus gunnari]|uniref:Uncharacterized protein n=1 Tax=Champsocephalus gunnari TaxID=52237 RepID=A0AAN8GX49_CHAGU|nr:hypothetical protein CgunFtcFv8_018508 [Champsocephalus gunnari]